MYFLPVLFSSHPMAFAHKHRETDFLLAPAKYVSYEIQLDSHENLKVNMKTIFDNRIFL